MEKSNYNNMINITNNNSRIIEKTLQTKLNLKNNNLYRNIL